MSYITPDDILDVDDGMGIAVIPPQQVAQYCDDASEDVDAYRPPGFSFTWWGGPGIGGGLPDPPAEQIPFDGHLRFWVETVPLRKVVSVQIVFAYLSGIPYGPTIQPQNVKCDFSLGSLEPVSFLIEIGAIPPLPLDVNPYALVSYTSGYDAGPLRDESGAPILDGHGNLQPTARDGLILPYPSWLTRATRAQALFLCSNWINNKRGMQGLEHLGTGEQVYRRRVTKAQQQTPHLAPEAEGILERHLENVYVGSTGEDISGWLY